MREWGSDREPRQTVLFLEPQATQFERGPHQKTSGLTSEAEQSNRFARLQV